MTELPSDPADAAPTIPPGDAATMPDPRRPRPCSVELTPGTRIGRYAIAGILGRGAMGVVYRALDTQLRRCVALKVPHTDHLASARGDRSTSDRARFVHEARGLARLSHPNVVQVFGVQSLAGVPGVADDGFAIAMEVVEGMTLDRFMVARRGLPQVLRVFEAAGRGLAAAHAAGLVHRDFKPSNVLIGSDGRVRVMDFGLVAATGIAARRIELEETIDDGDEDLTRTGITVGTPAYMAPEQHLGRPADPRSDQFSFCVALFEALFSMRPFAADDCQTLSVDKQLGRRRPLPAGHRVPRRVVEAVVRGLSPRPAERFPSMDALLAALSPRRRRAWIPTLAAGMTVAVLGTSVGFSLPAVAGALLGAVGPAAVAPITPTGADRAAPAPRSPHGE